MAKISSIDPKIRKIHILAISGQGMTTPIAIFLKKNNFDITGSDQQKIYPPASYQLKNAKIKINQTQINKKIDLAIIGSGFNKFKNTQLEFEKIKQLKIPYISATSFVAKHIIKKQSIIIAGSYGKTTTTGLLTWILIKANKNPSYLIGGKNINTIPSINIADSDWSVVEGDESINGLDTKAKFLYYPTKYVIITSTFWEHKESYSSQEDNLSAFRSLIKNIPIDGVLVFNQNDPGLVKISKICQGKIIPFSNKKFQTPLIGEHNQMNIAAAYTMAKILGIEEKIILNAIKTYRGIKRRIELIGSYKEITFIDDFAQSPPRIKSSLEAIAKAFPKRRIKVYLEPHASFILNTELIKQLKSALNQADLVVLSQIPYKKINSSDQRIGFKHFKEAIGDKISYIPLNHQLESFFQDNLKRGDILLHMSSGGQQGLKSFRNIVSFFKN